MIDGFLALYIFMLAAFTGKEIIGRVPVILHTPLMSGSNFVHGIVLVGAMVALAQRRFAARQGDRVHRRRARRRQCGRRLRRDRAHARDVQVQQSRQEGLSAAMDTQTLLVYLAKASYFLAAVLFILGIKRMSSPVTARKGIVQAGIGMVIATLATFAITGGHNLWLILAGIAIGVVPTWLWGKKVAMTDMPQMVALFNGMGGGSAAAIGAGELLKFTSGAETPPLATLALAVVGALIGSISMTGSIIAWAKLDGRMDKRFTFGGQQVGQLPCVRRRGAGRRRDRVLEARREPRRRVLRARARVRHPDDTADRRRRHAGRDLALQRADRSRGRVRRLRDADRGADHRGHGRRRGRHVPDAADGQGDEPPDQQRAFLELRWRRRRDRDRRLAKADRGERCGFAALSRRKSRHRAGLRHGRRAGAAQDLGALAGADQGRQGREVRDPSGRRPHAGPHERAARRSRRAVRSDRRHGRHQSGVQDRPTSRS